MPSHDCLRPDGDHDATPAWPDAHEPDPEHAIRVLNIETAALVHRQLLSQCGVLEHQVSSTAKPAEQHRHPGSNVCLRSRAPGLVYRETSRTAPSPRVERMPASPPPRLSRSVGAFPAAVKSGGSYFVVAHGILKPVPLHGRDRGEPHSSLIRITSPGAHPSSIHRWRLLSISSKHASRRQALLECRRRRTHEAPRSATVSTLCVSSCRGGGTGRSR